MKMPNSRQISEEQEDIYAEAPTNESVMIVGPPGTGKTVIAFLRAQSLNRLGKSAKVLMYNKVLKKYTENIEDNNGKTIDSYTLLSWMHQWWTDHEIPSTCATTEHVYLNCPFKEKDKAKALGAKWNKNKFNTKTKRKGVWYVDREHYDNNKSDFDCWIIEDIAPPKLADYQYDWDKMLAAAAVNGSMNEWGHLIIDEGQDFSKKMYVFLRYASSKMENGGLTILADENQRLHEDQNSTIEQIKGALAVKDSHFFRLHDNFRNTYQIAILAEKFYVGLATGKPRLPKRQGDTPELVATSSLEQQVDYIARVLTIRAPGEVGVFVQNDHIRQELFNILEQRLGEQYRIQSYSSNTKNDCSSEDLVFDTSGTITVLNRHSCKGLEFDMVFIPEIQTLKCDGSNLDAFNMNMYVMCSRARDTLYLLYSSQNHVVPDIVQHLPPKSSGLLEYKNA